MTLSILTNSALISLPPVFWFTRSTNAGGKVPSIPKRIPIFFIKCCPQMTQIYTDFSECLGFLNLRKSVKSVDEFLADFRQILRQHVAPVIPIVPAPSAIIEPMLD